MKPIRVDTGLLKREAEKLRRLGDSSDTLAKELARSLATIPGRDNKLPLPAETAGAMGEYEINILRDRLQEHSDYLFRLAKTIDDAERETTGGLAILWRNLEGKARKILRSLAVLFRILPAAQPVPLGPDFLTPKSCVEFYKKYHQCQGNSTRCADYSLSMVCTIYFDAKGESTSQCEVDGISKFIEWTGGKFPWKDGGTAPWGIVGALVMLGIPFVFQPFGSLNQLIDALHHHKIIIVSEGKFMDPKEGTWGHVVVIVGEEGKYFLLLDPAESEAQGVTPIEKDVFLNDWWYRQFHPCWIIG